MSYSDRYAAINSWCLRRGIDNPWLFFMGNKMPEHMAAWMMVHRKVRVVTDVDEPWLRRMENTVSVVDNA